MMKQLLLIIVVLLLLPFVLAIDPCTNNIKDPGEEGVDCGVAACGTPCSVYVGENLPTPGETQSVQQSQQVVSPIAEVKSSPSEPAAETELPQAPAPLEEPIGQLPPPPPTPSGNAQPVGQAASIAAPEVSVVKSGGYDIVGTVKTVFTYLFYLILVVGVFGAGYYGYTQRTVQKTNPELSNYLRKCADRNIPREKVDEKLREAGYSQKEIDFHYHQLGR